MSSQQRIEVSAKLAAAKPSSLAANEEVPEDVIPRVMKHIVLFVLWIGAVVFLGIVLATSASDFASVSNEHRLNYLGWSLIGAMAPGIILPVKAKSSGFWALYFILLISSVCMICA